MAGAVNIMFQSHPMNIGDTGGVTPQGPSPSIGPVLETRKLGAAYKSFAVLHDISIQLPRATIAAVLGANGADKTTLLRALCAMVQTSGEILVDGLPVSDLSTEKIVALGIAHVPEGRGTFTQLSVDENLQLGAYLRRDRRELRTDRERVLDDFPRLRERLTQQAGTLSGGEQQMLAIARALLSRPRVLLLDEPSFGLAPIMVSEVFEILKRVRTQYSVSILLVEQHVPLALELADHAYLLDEGRLVQSSDAASLQIDPALRASYLGQ